MYEYVSTNPTIVYNYNTPIKIWGKKPQKYHVGRLKGKGQEIVYHANINEEQKTEMGILI